MRELIPLTADSFAGGTEMVNVMGWDHAWNNLNCENKNNQNPLRELVQGTATVYYSKYIFFDAALQSKHDAASNLAFRHSPENALLEERSVRMNVQSLNDRALTCSNRWTP